MQLFGHFKVKSLFTFFWGLAKYDTFSIIVGSERNGQIMGNVTEVKENKMGIMPENRLLLGMSLPMMISMLVQALYNIVDSIFVSRINENALTAVSLAFPIQSLMIALGAGTGVGMNALLSKSLGEKDFDKVNKAAMNGIFLAAVSYIVFLVIGLFAVNPFYASQSTDPQILEYGYQYLTVVCCFSIGMYAQFVFERLLQSTGKTFYTMITQSTGAVINIILDPILIFGYLGMPKMGVTGAAVATVVGQIVAAIMAFIINQKKKYGGKIAFQGLSPEYACDRTDLCCWYSFYYYAGNRLRYDLRDEPDFDGIYLHGSSGVRCLFQTAELYLYAGIWTEQWYGAYYSL